MLAVRWTAPEGGFAVISALTDDGDEVTITGAIDHLHEGEQLEAQGRWRRHARHGWRFEVEQVHALGPASDAALLNLLASTKHVGPSGAAFLLERHGAEVLEAVDADPPGRAARSPGDRARADRRRDALLGAPARSARAASVPG